MYKNLCGVSTLAMDSQMDNVMWKRDLQQVLSRDRNPPGEYLQQRAP